MLALSKASHYVALFQEFIDTSVKGCPSLFRIDSVHQMESSFSQRFVGLLILKFKTFIPIRNYKIRLP
jgi:hypothetical protein